MDRFPVQAVLAASACVFVAPAIAQEVPTTITAVQLQPTPAGLELTLEFQGAPPPQWSSVQRDRTLMLNFASTQLRLPQGNTFRQENPAPEITSVLATQFEPGSIWIMVNGATALPTARLLRQDGRSLTLALTGSPPNQPSPASPSAFSSTPPTAPVPQPSPPDSSTFNPTPLPTPGAGSAMPGPSFSQAGPVSPPPSSFTSFNPAPVIGPPASQSTTAPVQIDPDYSDVYLDASQSQLMRTYQLNQVKATSDAIITQNLTSLAETGGTVGGSGNSFGSGSGGFSNFDVRASTATAQTSIKRTTTTTENVRYQGAKEFLELFGANNGGSSQPKAPFATAPSQFSDAQSSTSAFSQSSTSFSQPSFSSGFGGSGSGSRVLNGLEVIAEPRANTLTLIGPRRLVEIATVKLKQLDVLTKQVAINVKIIDVDLTKGSNSNADLQYQANETLGLGFNTAGSFFANVGRTATGAGVAAPLARNFLFNLLVSIRDQSAKILTNPTLVVQEGSSAQVNLTQEIFSGFETIEDSRFFGNTGVNVPLRRRPIIRPAGVIVNVTVDRIDAQGHVTLNISPEISAPSGAVFEDQGSQARLLLQRRLETGRIRLRDGQTLLLTGIIQDQDQSNVTKVPLLGDIPLLGRLFRRQEKSNERREVVIVVTPEILHENRQLPLGVDYQPGSRVKEILKQ